MEPLPVTHPAVYEMWETLLATAPASWKAEIDWDVSRKQLLDGLREAEIANLWLDPDAGDAEVQLVVPGPEVPCYYISFRVDQGDASLFVTKHGAVCQAVRKRAGQPSYPFSSLARTRYLETDIVHEFGHAVIAQKLGLPVDRVEIPDINVTEDPPKTYGKSKLYLKTDLPRDDWHLMAHAALAGGVGETIFRGEENRLRNALRLFASCGDYADDLTLVLGAAKGGFSVEAFDNAIATVSAWITPLLDRIAAQAHDIAVDAIQNERSSLILDWCDFMDAYPRPTGYSVLPNEDTGEAFEIE